MLKMVASARPRREATAAHRARVVVVGAALAAGATAVALPVSSQAETLHSAAVLSRPSVEVIAPRVVVRAQDQMMGNMSDDFEFQTMSYPGRSYSMLNCVDDEDQACGFYGRGSGGSPYHGTEYSPFSSNQWSTMMYPGSSESQVCYETDQGRSYGFYSTSAGGRTDGFWEKNGQWGSIAYPGSSTTGAIDMTEILGANNYGWSAGYAQGSRGEDYPLLYDVNTDSFKTLSIPGARSAIADGYNDSDEEVGYYTDNGSDWDGYSYENGQLTTYSVPGATMTEINGVNDYGQMWGMYQMPGGRTYGFIMDHDQIDTISDPSGGGSTEINGGNNDGTFVGQYSTPGGGMDGFVMEGVWPGYEQQVAGGDLSAQPS
ncbi:MAG TPA: hypothetical protein VMD59_22865 [Acidimicrobiales bacterium]|nr:hypothetical protein [Acidimicrobiales bacterium]